MKPPDEIKRLIRESDITSGPAADERILSDALDHLDKRRAGGTARPVPALWRRIMNSKATKLAAAAVIAIAVLVTVHFLGNPLSPTVTFAQVIQPILDANSAILDIIVGEEEEGVPVIHDMIMGSRIRRTMSNVPGNVSVIDLQTGRILSLDESKKEAVFVDLKGLPPIPNYLDRLKNVLVMLQDSPHFVTEDLGIRQIGGREAVGFRATHPKVEITLWADSRTGLPIRIDHKEGQLNIICKNLQFGVPLEETLFSMEVPEGYASQGQTEIDLMGATEEDFTEGLRIRTEVFGDGYFPDGVGVDDFMRSIEAMQGKGEELGLSAEQEAELGMKLNKHLLFIRFFRGQGKWYYRGQGVMLGEADKAIFWYRPKGSATYRVIYGDLRVEDVAPAELPEPLDADDVAGLAAGYEQWSDPNFVGTQDDRWTVDGSGRIMVESQIILARGPEGDANVPVMLPYPSGVMTSVTQGDTEVPFARTADGPYTVQLSLDKLLAGQREFVCRWQFSLGELPQKQHEDLEYYEVKLNTLIPVTSYSLTANLAPDSGFEFSIAPSQSYLLLFSKDNADGETQFGTCGLPIRKRN